MPRCHRRARRSFRSFRASPCWRGWGVVAHFLDLVDERANGFEKRAEVRAAAKSMFVSVDRIPLQSHDVARRILDTARDLVGLAMLVQLEHPCGFLVGPLERVALLR